MTLIADDSPRLRAPRPRRPAGPRRTRRRVARQAAVVTHRWLSLLLGLLLVVITTTGAVVLYTPEWTVWSNDAVFEVADPSATPKVSMPQALAAVDRAHPGFQAGGVNRFHGLYEVTSVDPQAHPGFYGVDPTTGRLTGFADPHRGFMGLMNQVHECFFSCETYPAYLPLLDTSVPSFGIAWLADVTWATVALGGCGLLLLFLGLTGIWLWWPTLRRIGHGFRVRWRRGWYARDYDLHKVVGIAAVPFLLMWGLTGANFEFPFVGKAWYAVTGGHAVPDSTFTSTTAAGSTTAPSTTPDVGLPAALAAAVATAGPDRPLVSASLPAVDDETATYSFWFADGFDQYRYGGSPGDWNVSVDRRDATRVQVSDYSNASTLSNQLLDNLGASTFHFGQSVNGWWRLIWFVFGLTPLVLMWTGVSTWLAKLVMRRRRARLRAARAATT